MTGRAKAAGVANRESWRHSVQASVAAALLALSIMEAAAQVAAPGQPAPAKACVDAVQGKVAWNRAGNKVWQAGNLALICAGVTDAATVATVVPCFEEQIRATNNWQTAIQHCNKPAGPPLAELQSPAEKQCIAAVQGKVAWDRAGSMAWEEQNLALLCGGVTNAAAVVSCFEQEIRFSGNWVFAVGNCNAASELRAIEVACSERSKLRSQKGTEGTSIAFVNSSGKPRTLLWIDHDGELKSFATLQPGEQKQQKTYVTHPWVVATQNGECLQIVMPRDTHTFIQLRSDAAVDPAPGPK